MMTLFLFATPGFVYAQSIGINPTGSTPNPSAGLDIDFGNKGLLIPRVALIATNSNTPVGPGIATSLLVYNTSTSGVTPFNVTPGYYYWDGSGWIKLLTALNANDWSTTGNAGTVDGVNFIGTTDNVPLNFRVNNQKAGRIDSTLAVTFLGYKAGNSNSSGINNTATGSSSLYSNTTGANNTAAGYSSLYANTTGAGNTASGYDAMYANKTGWYNTAYGFEALYSGTTAFSNVAVGAAALRSNTVRANLVAVGDSALFSNGIGASAFFEAIENTAIGSKALFANNTGYRNTALGHWALQNNTTGNANTAAGTHALYSNTTGLNNTATGRAALALSISGHGNTANGAYALNVNTSGWANTANGATALKENTSGGYNSAFGSGSLTTNITGNFNTGLGCNTDVDDPNRTNSVVIGGIGNLALGGDNRVRIGNNSVTSIGGQVGWTTISDERVKTEFINDVAGMKFILRLKPVTYTYSIEASNRVQHKSDTLEWNGKYDIEKIRFSGFRAQEVNRVAAELGYDFSGVDKPQDENGLWGLRYADFVVPLVKAFQEMHEKFQIEMTQLRLELDIITQENNRMKQYFTEPVE